EGAAALLDGVGAHMEQQFGAGGGDQADGVVGVKEVVHHGVGGGVEFALGGLDGDPVAQGAGGESLVLHFGHGHHRAGHVCAQHLGDGGFGRGGGPCRGGGRGSRGRGGAEGVGGVDRKSTR